MKKSEISKEEAEYRKVLEESPYWKKGKKVLLKDGHCLSIMKIQGVILRYDCSSTIDIELTSLDNLLMDEIITCDCGYLDYLKRPFLNGHYWLCDRYRITSLENRSKEDIEDLLKGEVDTCYKWWFSDERRYQEEKWHCHKFEELVKKKDLQSFIDYFISKERRFYGYKGNERLEKLEKNRDLVSFIEYFIQQEKEDDMDKDGIKVVNESYNEAQKNLNDVVSVRNQLLKMIED